MIPVGKGFSSGNDAGREAILVGIASIFFAFGINLAAQQPAPFTAKANLVVVPAVVVDKKGATVGGLTQSDFTILEDGTPVPIETFLAPSADGVTGEAGRFIVLALDNMATKAEDAFQVKSIAKRFVGKMGPADVMSVISISGGKAVTTTMKTELNAAIDRFSPGGGAGVMTFNQMKRHGLETITSLTRQMEKADHRRKVLVFIGDNGLLNPNDPSADQTGDLSLLTEWQEAIAATTRNNVSVYLIDPKGSGAVASAEGQSSRPASVPRDPSPYGFTVETGGDAWYGTNNFAGAVNRIWQESASYYLLGYVPPVTDNKIHKIEVRVMKPGVTVRARKARG